MGTRVVGERAVTVFVVVYIVVFHGQLSVQIVCANIVTNSLCVLLPKGCNSGDVDVGRMGFWLKYMSR